MRLTSVIHSWPHISLNRVHFAITTLFVPAIMPENNSDKRSHSGEGQSSREDIALVSLPLFFSLVLFGDTNRAIYLAIRNCLATPMDPYSPFGLPFTYYHGLERGEQFAPQFGYRMPMIAPSLQFSSHSGPRATIPP